MACWYEINEQLGEPPKTIFSSVGGGGLLGGIMIGVDLVGWLEGELSSSKLRRRN